MNEELTLAIEELRQRPTNQSWFIPVLLNECEVPNRSIGAGETLRSLQWVALYEDWDKGVERILTVVKPDSAKVHELIQLLGHESARIRIRAADDLGAMGTLARPSVEALTRLLADENDTVKAVAADALGRIGDATDDVIQQLLETALHGEYYSRANALDALAKIGKQAVPAILEVNPEKLAAVTDPTAVPDLIKALTLGYVSAATALGVIGPAASSALPVLIGCKGKESTEALGRIGDPEAVPELIRRLKSDDAWTRVHATEALGKIGDPIAIEALLEVLTSGDDLPAKKAAMSLLAIGSPDAIEKMVPLLIRNLKHTAPASADLNLQRKSTSIRADAAEILGIIGHLEFVPLLIPLLSEDQSIFESAATSLQRIGSDEAIQALIPELKRRSRSKDNLDRITSARLLGMIGDSSFVSTLADLLRDADYGVSHTAAEALREIGTPDAMAYLKDHAKSRTPKK